MQTLPKLNSIEEEDFIERFTHCNDFNGQYFVKS